jgi:hypothetical protein
MSKKKKKVFKQKINQLLHQQKEVSVSSKPAPSPHHSPSSPVSIKIDFPLFDFRKVMGLFFGMVLVMVAVAIFAQKGSWVSLFADQIYRWARLGD